MNVLYRIMSFTAIALSAMTVCCACQEDLGSKVDNPFGEGGKSPLSASYTSNADTVFLKWTIVDETVAFDSYLVADKNGRNSVALEKTATECELTHIPYNRNVDVRISLMADGKEVRATVVPVNIDGFDREIAKLIMPDKGSVTEGDGMYSIALPDGRSLFLMGDSYLGEVSGNRRVSGNHMYRNTYSIYDPKDRSSIGFPKGGTASAAVPEGNKDEGKEWYWPGHGFVVDNTVYVVQYKMFNTGVGGSFAFDYIKSDIIEYSLPDFTERKITEIPFKSSDNTIHYGAAALNDGDWLYFYAQVDIENDFDPVTEVLLARTTVENMYTYWEYYTGSGWSTDSSDAVKLTGLDSVPISSQFNVFKLDGKYVLISQDKTFNSGKIYTFTSDSPQGPWGNKKLIYSIPKLEEDHWFTYNAMAHPQFEKDGMILVTFNVNTEVFSEQASNVASYRPRFFWIEKDDILK